MAHKVILVACGSGVATSETAAYKVRKIAAERKWDVEVRVVDFRKLRSVASQADVLIHIAPNDPTDYGIPRINGVPFLTGFGLEKVVNELEAFLKADKPIKS
ncbi:MAG: PTS sugar transporter subunit IIB [Anaerolineaceae bacterium]|nr:PTS sugar transporter subunit IIB [Anaerolineaceae bacterium]